MLTTIGTRLEACKTSTIVSKLEILKLVETLNSNDTSTEDREKLAEFLSDVIRKSVVNFGQGPEKLTPLLHMVLKILGTWINDEAVEVKLKEGNLVVEWLSYWINPNMEEDDITSVMKIISKLTKDTTSPFQPRSITNLVRICLQMVVAHNEHTERFIAAVKILIHICSSDLKCSIIARSEKTFKAAWEKITSFILQIKNKNLFCDDDNKTEGKSALFYTQYVQYRVPLLLVHLIYSLESGPNFQILHWGMVQGSAYAKWCFNHCISNVDHSIACDGLNELIEFLHTIFNQAKIQFKMCKLKSDESLEDLGIPMAYIEEVKRLEGMVDELSSSVLKILHKKLEITKFSCEYTDGLIKLVRIVCPSEFPIKGIHAICTEAYEIVSGLWKNNFEKLGESQKGQMMAQALETYVHIANVFQQEKERRSELPGDYHEKQWQSLFAHLMKEIKLVPPNQPEMERINVACCRLISLTKLSGLIQQNQINHSGFKQQVIVDIIDYCLFHPSITEGATNESILSLFVEVLGYLGDNSTVVGPDLFLQYSSMPNVPEIFALALSSGFENVVFKALRVMSHVGFCKDTMQQVAANLSACQKPVFPVSTSQTQLKISSQAVKGVQKLEERLETLVHSYEEPIMDNDDGEQLLAISEIFSLYEVKDTIYQSERNGLLQQITDLTIYIDRLKSMMDKQAVLLSRKASHEAAKERQIMVLNFHCEKAKKSLSALQKRHADLITCMGFKDSAILKNEEEIKDLQNTISAIKRESKSLKDNIVKQQAMCDAVEKDAKQVKEENKDLIEKIAHLEREVKRKEEERKHIEELLTQKNEQFNGIRALLQNANRML